MHPNAYSVETNLRCNNCCNWTYCISRLVVDTIVEADLAVERWNLSMRCLFARYKWNCCTHSQSLTPAGVIPSLTNQADDDCTSLSSLVIISITRYRDNDREFIERTISWRPYIIRYRARMSLACAARILQWWRLRLIDVACRAHCPWLPLRHIPCGRPIMQSIGSLGWGLGNGSCASGGLNYACRKAHCARRTA